jgi:tetratricopeptide (TPR) repeat protein
MKSIIPVLLIVFLIFGCGSKSSQSNIDADKIREYANELYNRYLFKQAIEQYQYYLDHYSVPEKEQANIIYRIGNIYFDRLHDYENAFAEFLKVKTLYPESTIIPDVNKKVVACLERLQRPEDAQQAIRESADLQPQKRESKPGKVIAEIGDREITQGDLDFEINQLPQEIRSQYKDKKKKLEFLRRYMATEIMYDSAKRQGLDEDKEVLENVFQAKKTFMVQKLLEQEISKKVDISEDDVKLYYQANKEKYAEKDDKGKVVRQPPLSEVQKQVAQDLLRERQQKAYDELMASLLRADNVKIYDDLVK